MGWGQPRTPIGTRLGETITAPTTNLYAELAANNAARTATLLECERCAAILRPGMRTAHDAWHAVIDRALFQGSSR